MYVVNGNWTVALDVATGQPIWRTPVEYERAAARVGTAGALMRGAPRFTMVGCFASRLIVTSSRST